jgi:hypothetical protein
MPDKRKEGGSSSSATGSAEKSLGGSSAKKARVAVNTGGTVTESSRTNVESLTYDPVHFIRSHSKNNDPADIQTQIWEVVFEPDPKDQSKTTSRVATCGGNSICIVDVNTGTVLMKYKHKELKENFYTLAWTTLQFGEIAESSNSSSGKSNSLKSNILVSGRIRGEIRMFHPENKVFFHEWRPVEKKGIAVNSLIFHSEQATWLFCGTSDGVVSLWDIGQQISLPSYDGVNPQQLLKLFPDYGDVYNIAWSGANRWLLAGTAAGLVGWNIDDEKVDKLGKDYRPLMLDFLMPESDKDRGENPIVDSLAVASDWTIVSKCALHGLIYVFDLKTTIKGINLEEEEAAGQEEGASRVIEKDVELLASLKWSDTDNFYMNLGCHKGSGLICCGDDKGSLWLYNQPKLVLDCKTNSSRSETILPTVKLMWPDVQDDKLENTRKLPLSRHEIIVDKVVSSDDKKYVVAVTSNNMICIWKQTDQLKENSEKEIKAE